MMYYYLKQAISRLINTVMSIVELLGKDEGKDKCNSLESNLNLRSDQVQTLKFELLLSSINSDVLPQASY